MREQAKGLRQQDDGNTMMKFRLDATSCATVAAAAATAAAGVDVDVNRIMNFTQNVELEYYAREGKSKRGRERARASKP